MVHTRQQKTDVLTNSSTTSLNTNFTFNMLPFDNFNTSTGNTPMTHTPIRPVILDLDNNITIPEDFETELISSLQPYAKELNSGFVTPTKEKMSIDTIETPFVPSGLYLRGGYIENDIEADKICQSMLNSVNSTPIKQIRNDIISPPKIIRQKYFTITTVTTITSTTKVLELVKDRLDNLQVLKRGREEEDETTVSTKRICSNLPRSERKSYTAAPPLALSPSKQITRFIIQNKIPLEKPLEKLLDNLNLQSNDCSNTSSANISDNSSDTSSDNNIPLAPVNSPIIELSSKEQSTELPKRKRNGFLTDNYASSMTNEEYLSNLQLRLRTYAFPGSYNLRNTKSSEKFLMLLQRERMLAESKGISFAELKELVNFSFSAKETAFNDWKFGIDLPYGDIFLDILKDFFKE